MFAGPSEILIIADETAVPDYLAADLLSQAEHDRLASAVLVCTDASVAQKTADCIEKRLEKLPRREIAAHSIENNGKIILVKNLDEAAEISDALAPEHLEIMTADPESVLRKVRNAGQRFSGEMVARTHRRLFRRTQSHASHFRHGKIFFAAGR